MPRLSRMFEANHRYFAGAGSANRNFGSPTLRPPCKMNRFLARVLRRMFRRIELGAWRLPFEYYMHVLDGTREPELKHLYRICPNSGVAVDVGANLGYYTFKMARRYSRVYAFEANSEASAPIRASGLDNVCLINKGLSKMDGEAVLYIPVVNGLALSGWASLEPDNCPDATHHLERQTELTTLDAFQLERVDLIKIDVEGHEFEVLQGACRTIAASRPTLIVEIKKNRFGKVRDLLAGYGYAAEQLKDVVGLSGSPENFIFRPKC